MFRIIFGYSFSEFLYSFLALWQENLGIHEIVLFNILIPVFSLLVLFLIIFAAVEDSQCFLISSSNFSPLSKNFSNFLF